MMTCKKMCVMLRGMMLRGKMDGLCTVQVQYGNVEEGKRTVLIRSVYTYVSMYTYIYIVRNMLSGTMDGLNQVYTYVLCVCVCVCIYIYCVLCVMC